MLTGLICAGVPSAGEVWIDELFTGSEKISLPDAQTLRALQALASHTRDEVVGPGFGFTPLLPQDEYPLRERATALYDWTRGFVYGLSVASVRQDDLSEQGREVISDFAEITRMDLDDLDEDEDNETALAELQEFVRVAAMLVFEERVTTRDERHAKG